MPLAPLQLAFRSNRSKFQVEGDSRLINCYVEDLGADAVYPQAAYAMPGLQSWTTLTGGGKTRAALRVGSKFYVVSGRNVFAVESGGTATNIGGIATDGPVYMAQNQKAPFPEIGIQSDGLFFRIDTASDDLYENTDLDLPPSSSFDVIDGFGILPGLSNDTWYITAANDFSQIDGLDFASAEASPDAIRRVIAFNREIWFFGEKTTEQWQNTGGTFPFSRVSTFELGCMAGGSVAKIDQKLIWVDDKGIVRMSSGQSGGERVSNHGIERAIKAETDQENMTATTWTDEGHHFYCLNGSTFSYQWQVGTPYWQERNSRVSGADLGFWRVSLVTEFDGDLIAGDYTSGALYKMRSTVFDEIGEPLIVTMQPAGVHARPLGLIHSRLDLDMTPGVGLNTTVASELDPEVMIDYSEDGGATFKNETRHALGRLGATNTKIKRHRLGTQRSNSRTYRFRVSAAVKRGFYQAALHAKKAGT